ncbi:MAG TPA: hypothetical protein VIN59_00540, partial [Alphaproteobacteria bacterium]
IVPPHTPSVKLVMPESKIEYPAFLKAAEDTLVAYFNDHEDHGPFYASFTHSGIYIFFARTHDKKDFLKDMKGAFVAIDGEEQKNLEIAHARIKLNFNAQTTALGRDYAYLNGDRSAKPSKKRRVSVSPKVQSAEDLAAEEKLYAEAVESAKAYVAVMEAFHATRKGPAETQSVPAADFGLIPGIAAPVPA